MSKLALFATLLVVGATSLHAQTTNNLPSSLCGFQASNYLDCSQMGIVQIGTDTYAISSVFNITNVYQWLKGSAPASGTLSGLTITFQDVSVNPYTFTTEDVTGTYSFNPDGSHHISAAFEGPFNGTLNFDVVIVKPVNCIRYCISRPFAENVVLVTE